MNVPEATAVKERYARRSMRYEPWDPSVYLARQELERRTIEVLLRAGQLPPAGRRLLDIGCGHGGNLRFFLSLGYRPADVFGNELIEDRADAARSGLPEAVTIVPGDATAVVLPGESFDVVFQSLVFSSILDDAFQAKLAAKMWSLVRPGGGVLWYDFVYNNPRNHDVRGVSLRRVQQLFGVAPLHVRSVTLAPPLSRPLTRIHPGLYGLANTLPLLRTHRLCWIHKI